MLPAPLLVEGEHAQGTFYVPLATTEGALVRSYERGMTAITRSGGATARVTRQENSGSPIFCCEDVAAAFDLANFVRVHVEQIKTAAEATTNHGQLVAIETRLLGKDVVVDFRYDTADAHGMNMITKATDAACRWITENCHIATKYYLLSGASCEKRPSASLFRGAKGKYVVAGALVRRRIARSYLRATPEQISHTYTRGMLAQGSAGVLGHNGHYANGLTAIYLACGQDVANVVNSAVGMTYMEVTEEGDLYATATLPSLTVATVGGGTALGTSPECLRMLGCLRSGKALKLAEIVAAALLAGDLSMAAALASSEFAGAHEACGRNKPADGTVTSQPRDDSDEDEAGNKQQMQPG